MKRLVCALLALAPAAAGAAKYAAMDQVPVEGGELRLEEPSGPSIAFPLRHTSVDIDVDGPMAQVEVEQVFENPFNQALEAVYVFPLADEAAVVDYEIVVGDHTVRGQIDRREAARRRYEEAKASGRTAGLLEEHKRNVFSQSVANIPPRQVVRVRFVYVELLEPRDGAYELVFPMVVGPRYLPGQTSDPHPVGAHPAGTAPPAGVTSVPYLPPGQRSGHDISLHACVDAGVPLKSIASPSHAIVSKRIDDTTVELDLGPGDTIPNKDFVLRYSGAGDANMVGLLTHRAGGDDGFFTLVLQPKAAYKTGDIAPREMVLVIDRSGSMDGAPLAQAKGLARALLASLNGKDSFNVITFADGVDSFAPAPVVASDENRRRAEGWIDAVQAGGGTELGRGVAASLVRRPGGDRIRMVYLMSDGYVGNDDEIVAGVRGALAQNRVFPIGVGAAVNRALLDRLGGAGRGFTSYLLPADAPDALAATLVRRTAYPFLTDVRIAWGGLDVKNVTPVVLPDVYAGMPLVVSGRYGKAGKGRIVVEATSAGKRTSAPLDVELPAAADNPPVAYLWARGWLHELERKDGPDARKAIADLGLAFHMVTAETSFVAVDERVVAGGGKGARKVLQPVEMPEGVGWEGVFGEDDGSGGQQVASASPSPSSSSRSSSSSSSDRPSSGHHYGGGGGGGAVDVFTLLSIASFVPMARALRKRRRA